MLLDEYDELSAIGDEKRWDRAIRNCFVVSVTLLIVAVGSCCAYGQIKVSPEYSVGQPVIAEVSWPEAPEGAKATDLLWEIPGAGVFALTDSTVAIWPEFGATDKQLVITVSGLLTTADGKYVPKSNRTFKATTLLRGIVATPPVPPGPGPGPQPPPVPADEAPIKEPGFRVLITYESQLPTPRWLNDADFRALLNQLCVGGPNGVKEWRIVDKDSPTVANAGVWPAALARTKGKPVPWLMISTGKIGFEGPLPENKTEAMAKIRQYAEAK